MIQGTTQQQQKCIYFIDDNSKEETECIHYSLIGHLLAQYRCIILSLHVMYVFFLVVNSTKISVEIEWQNFFVCLI
jgi:hypothetical protein